MKTETGDVMKAILSTVLLTGLAASAAHAEGLQVETRAFHSNLRIDGSKVTLTDEESSVTADVNKTFLNTAGLGVAAVYGVNEAVDLGVGFSLASYFPETDSQIDQTVVNGFMRYNFIKTESGKLYGLVGVSRHFLNEEVDEEEGYDQTIRIKPVANVDAGFGGTLTWGSVDLGLEYKYSNSVSRGRVSIKESYTYSDALGLRTVESSKTRFTGLKLEGQELALTLGVKL
jgi:hypothetical protein